jgi:hypothetical protein
VLYYLVVQLKSSDNSGKGGKDKDGSEARKELEQKLQQSNDMLSVAQVSLSRRCLRHPDHLSNQCCFFRLITKKCNQS